MPVAVAVFVVSIGALCFRVVGMFCMIRIGAIFALVAVVLTVLVTFVEVTGFALLVLGVAGVLPAALLVTAVG